METSSLRPQQQQQQQQQQQLAHSLDNNFGTENMLELVRIPIYGSMHGYKCSAITFIYETTTTCYCMAFYGCVLCTYSEPML